MAEDQSPETPAPETPAEEPASPLERLHDQLLVRWNRFPAEDRTALNTLLEQGLARAKATDPEVITVMNPVSRPMRLRLGVIASDAGLDRMYRREWGEFSVSDRGRCYLVYRRGDGDRYAIEWSPATTIPETMMKALPDPLALAILEGDIDD